MSVNHGKVVMIGEQLGRCAVPIFFIDNQGPPAIEKILKNATGILIDTGEKEILVTCQHVWSVFQEECRRNQNLRLGVGCDGLKITLFNPHVIDEDANYDIAVFELNFKHALKDKVIYKATYWPPLPPSVKDAALFLGYPGSYRYVLGQKGNILSGKACFIDSVSSVSERSIILADEKNVREIEKHMAICPDLGLLGGMSGGPVFIKRNNKHELIGIIRAADNGPHAIIFATPLYYIKPDGTLDFIHKPHI